MTVDEKKVGVCEDCKYIIVYEGIGDDMEPTDELVFFCGLLEEDVALNHSCQRFEERPLF